MVLGRSLVDKPASAEPAEMAQRAWLVGCPNFFER
jgi:hypothetical protein